MELFIWGVQALRPSTCLVLVYISVPQANPLGEKKKPQPKKKPTPKQTNKKRAQSHQVISPGSRLTEGTVE